MPQLRAPVARPENTTRGYEKRIAFRHPAYPDAGDTNVLLFLDAVDDDGIDYNTALAACGLVACNRWLDAWFGIKQAQSQYQHIPHTEILPYIEDGYYFFVSQDTSLRYPVVPSFDHWPFPHADLPEPWKRLRPPAPANNIILEPISPDPRGATIERDGGCRVTGVTDATEAAHLVPIAVTGWFGYNRMQRYCRVGARPNPVDDEANMITLRRDLHYLFGQRKFAIVPKTDSDSDSSRDPQGDALPVFHVLQPGRPLGQLHSLFHNRALQPPRMATPKLSPEFLFARFAWAILCDENYPLLRASRRLAHLVHILDPDSGNREDIELSGDVLKDRAILFAAPSRIRSVSPQKRKREAVDEGVDEDNIEDDVESEEHGHNEEEPFRGRSRYRTLWPCQPRLPSPQSRDSSELTYKSMESHNMPVRQTHTPDYSPPANVFPDTGGEQKCNIYAGEDEEEESLETPARLWKRRRIS